MTTMNRRRFSALAGATALTLAGGPAMAQSETEVRMYFPVAVGGPVTKIIDEYAANFEKANPGIKIKPIYAGDYVQTITKVLTAIKGGDTPETAILLAADLFTLYDEDVIVPIDNFVKSDADKKWLGSFYPAFMENARVDGKTYAIRSSARRRCSTTTRTPSRPPASTRTRVRRTGPKCARWPRS